MRRLAISLAAVLWAGAAGTGMAWAADRDKTYASTMTLSGDTLAVAGCVLGGLICRSQAWTRVK